VIDAIYRKSVSVDGYRYKIFIYNTFDIIVVRDEYREIISQGFWHDEVSGCAVWGDVKYPRKVMMAVLDEVVTAIKITKIPYFTFSAAEDNRFALYKRLAPIIEAKTGYKLQVYDDMNKFIFTKEKPD